MMTEVEKEIREQKETLFKESQKLFKLRAEQANLIGDISGTLSASRNLQASINKLTAEKTRQQELLYSSEYQIQQMERSLYRLLKVSEAQISLKMIFPMVLLDFMKVRRRRQNKILSQMWKMD